MSSTGHGGGRSVDCPYSWAPARSGVLSKQPMVVSGHAFISGQIPRLTDFEKPPAAARLMAGPMDSACSATHFGATKGK